MRYTAEDIQRMSMKARELIKRKNAKGIEMRTIRVAGHRDAHIRILDHGMKLLVTYVTNDWVREYILEPEGRNPRMEGEYSYTIRDGYGSYLGMVFGDLDDSNWIARNSKHALSVYDTDLTNAVVRLGAAIEEEEKRA